MAEMGFGDFIVRGLQFAFAIAVMGTDGYAIHGFRGSSQHVNDPVYDGDAVLHTGVPAAWSFLMFCAAWTIVAIFLTLLGLVRPGSGSYLGMAIEAVAVLSWLAGFIAVAVNVASSKDCSTGQNSCGALKAAAVFGAIEFLLFLITAAAVIMRKSQEPELVSTKQRSRRGSSSHSNSHSSRHRSSSNRGRHSKHHHHHSSRSRSSRGMEEGR